MEERALHLKNLISVELLQKVQDNFSDALGVALVIVDEQGVPITNPSGFSQFCMEIRSDAERIKRCFKCDDAGGRMAMSAGHPVVYRCQCGLVEFASPITVEGYYLGALVSGQVRVEPEKEKEIDFIFDLDQTWQNNKRLTSLFKDLNTISFKKFQSATNSLFYVSNYLAEQGYSNMMQKKLLSQSVTLAKESKKRVDLEKSLQEAELQALSYQINPHFLFNVLNTIGRLAFLENAHKTEATVYGFSDMMRYILKKSDNKLITIKSETRHVENYMMLQKVRMGEKFSFQIDIPEKYLEIPCPFLVLQPLVENCFNYTVEPRDQKSHISIKAYDDGTDVILEINDNGDGIAADRIQDALTGTARRQNRVGLGIFNVSNRLKLYFGDDYGLQIESPGVKGGGTKIIIRCPLVADINHQLLN